MNSSGAQSAEAPHRYPQRFIFKIIPYVPAVMVLVIMLITMGACLLVARMPKPAGGPDPDIASKIVWIVALPPVLILSVGIIIRAAIMFVTPGTYIEFSAGGIEYQRWPYIGMRCGWEDVEQADGLAQYRRGILRLKRCEYFGPQLAVTAGELFRRAPVLTIHLAGIQGWPNGALRDDLVNYVPHLFDQEAP